MSGGDFEPSIDPFDEYVRQENRAQAPYASTGYTPKLYTDIGLLLSGDAPEPPQPTIGNRTDGFSLIYPAAANVLFGSPEGGKTLAASCIAADELFEGGSVLMIDIDHNGAPATVARFRSFGVSGAVLSDTQKFRYAAPEDATEMLAIIADARLWTPTLCVLDSIGELLPMFGANSNDADDYTRVHRSAITPFTLAGTAVLAIDHEAKGTDSRNYGSSGTAAKKRAIDGAMLRVTVKEAFTPGKGGKAALTIVKDRHGGVRANSPTGQQEPLAAVFQLTQRGEAIDWKFWAPKADGSATDPTVESDAAELDQLNPEPTSVRDVQARLKWSPRRAAPALAKWREKRYPNTTTVTR